MAGLGSLGSLSPLPSPTSGIPATNVMPGLAEGLGEIATAVQARKDRKRKEAEGMIPILSKMVQAQPGNQQAAAQLVEAYRTLGIAVPTKSASAAQAGTSQAATGAGALLENQPTQAAPTIRETQTQPPSAGSGAQWRIPQSAPSLAVGGEDARMPMVQPAPTNLAPQATLPTIGTNAALTAPDTAPHGTLPDNASAEQRARHGLLAGLWNRLHPTERAQFAAGQQQPQSASGAQRTTPDYDFSGMMPQRDLSGADADSLMSYPPGPRRAAAKAMGYANLGDDFLDAPAILKPGSPGAIHVQTLMTQEQAKVAGGQETASGFNKWLAANDANIRAAQINPDDLRTDPSTVQQLSALAQAKIKDLEAHGVHFKEADKIALMRATSTDQVQAAQTRLISARAAALPQEDAHKWAFQKRQSDATQQRANTYSQRVLALDQQAQGGSKSAIGQIISLSKLYDGDDRALSSQINREQNFLDTQINLNGLDPESQQAKDIQAHIDTLTGQQTQARQARDTMLQKYTGSQALNSQIHASGAPITSQFTQTGGSGGGGSSSSSSSGVDLSTADETATAPDGRKAYHINGKWVDKNGKPMQ